jgi:hypothetical protein
MFINNFSMKKFYWGLLVLICFAACKNSEADLNGNDKVTADNFLKAFHELNFPVIISDSTLKNFGDSTVISKAVFAQYISDSALQSFTGNSDDYIIHPAGSLHKKEADFLLAKFSSPKQNKLGVFVLDDKHKFLAAFPLLSNAQKDNYIHSVSITEEPTFIFKKEKIVNNKSLYSRNGFAYNAASKTFAEVLHDSNEDTMRNNEVINPIDTFPSTNKYSGDYIKDEKNFIAVRDGKSATTYAFFIHFDKKNGDCTGELKGMMSLTDEKTAVFTESGDPCVINFKFTSNSIIIKEQDNCGNHRGITCPFDFTFKKEKPEKKKTK